MRFSMPADKKYFHKPEINTIFYCNNYKFTRNERQIMLKSTQNVLFQWRSPSLGYSLVISLQPGIMMQRRKQALKVAIKPLNN